ncbi:SRPBCC domain-containing protein [Paenibacillus aquistagni]|uniref:SRPBCC domain-containing protein n=1 Tax=Paenibacillus aquistagni TaxID=1852522 RepID=UPI000B4FDD23|nr:SRPBCC domain-containing protein [Paenibacillus aquistagni]
MAHSHSNDRPAKPVGLTESVGYQIGVRRTLPCSRLEAWNYLVSSQGLPAWLGDPQGLLIEVGNAYGSEDTAHGEIRVLRKEQQIRMTWQQLAWSRPSTLQIRLIEVRPQATTVSIHQEHLDDGGIRLQMKKKWEDALADMSERLRCEGAS